MYVCNHFKCLRLDGVFDLLYVLKNSRLKLLAVKIKLRNNEEMLLRFYIDQPHLVIAHCLRALFRQESLCYHQTRHWTSNVINTSNAVTKMQ